MVLSTEFIKCVLSSSEFNLTNSAQEGYYEGNCGSTVRDLNSTGIVVLRVSDDGSKMESREEYQILLLFEGKKNIVVLTKPRPYASAFVVLREQSPVVASDGRSLSRDYFNLRYCLLQRSPDKSRNYVNLISLIRQANFITFRNYSLNLSLIVLSSIKSRASSIIPNLLMTKASNTV